MMDGQGKKWRFYKMIQDSNVKKRGKKLNALLSRK